MNGLTLRPAAECRWDQVSLGEIMLRLDPGEMRIHTTRRFSVWEGGGEYNVARGLRRCFALRTAVVTALVDNPVGRLVEDLILQGGVDVSHVLWRADDGCGRAARNGLNFTERGFGVRGAVGCSDRGHTAVSQLRPGEVAWDEIFGREGARWFHCGGIFAALGPATPEVTVEAMQSARKHGAVVSYDLNYRPSLWKGQGGPQRAIEVNREIARHVDVLIGNEEDFTLALGYEVEGLDAKRAVLEPEQYQAMMERGMADYGNIKMIAITLRRVRSATLNDWGALCLSEGKLHRATQRNALEVFDRVGGGDSFASGLIYGLLAGKPAAEALEYGAAHGALAMTTPGDASMATLKEVQKLAAGGTARVER